MSSPLAAGVLIVFAAFCFGCDFSERRGDAGGTGRGAGGNQQIAGNSASATVEPHPAKLEADALRAEDWFEDLTSRTGIGFTHHSGRESGRFFLIESFGGGVAMLDYDLDGDVDLFFTGGGTISAPPSPPQVGGLPSALYRNEGDWRFSDSGRQAGFAEPADYSLACNVVDYDGDGFPDLFLCCYGRSRLYRNSGDGTFRDDRRLPAFGMATASAWADIDRDGFPDLFLARYVEWSPETDKLCYSRRGERDLCGPNQYDPTVALFFHNRGDGGFENWSGRVGLKPEVKGLGLVAGDFNDDGWIDFYLANDELANHLYWGREELPLAEAGWRAGVAANELGMEEGSMGVDAQDVNGDGRSDLWVVNFENEDNSLYLNRGTGLFEHRTLQMGLGVASRLRVAWGTALADFDGDGWLDIVVINGHAVYRSDLAPWEEVPNLFRSMQGKRFEEVSRQGGAYFRRAHAGRGGAVGDLDGDGAPDLVVSHINEPVTILRNRIAPPNFVSVRLRATGGAIGAVGARVSARFGLDRELVRFVTNGAGYASHSDDRIVFPIEAAAGTLDVTVRWPGRQSETFGGLAGQRTHVLIEGRGRVDDRE